MTRSSSDDRFYQDQFMDLSSYRLERMAPGADWDRLVDLSPQGTLFSLSSYLGALAVRPGLWCCLKNDQPKALVAVMESADGLDCVEHDLVIHGGLMMLAHDDKQNPAQVMGEEFRITSFVVREMTRRYRRVVLAMSPFLHDLRPFLWHNHGRETSRFALDLRYTSFLDLAGIGGGGREDRDPVLLRAGKSRRQEIRYARKKGVVTRPESDVGLFVDFYRLTFSRQGKTVDEAYLEDLASLVRGLLAAGQAAVFVARTASGAAGSVAVFGWDAKRAYYLFGANDPALRDAHTGSAVLWDALGALAGQGIAEVDLEGINSPLRGHFKLSFGGSITPYFIVSLEP